MEFRTLALVLCVLPLIAAVRIDTIHYDPFNEAGSEFVLLENTGAEPVDLAGWTIATSASMTDATLEGTMDDTFLITDEGWNEGKDNASWPDADHEETLTLGNTAGFVQVIDASGTVQDTVGYGDTDIFETAPAQTVEEGQALVRIQDTDNNAEDFEARIPSFDSPTTIPDGEQAAHLNVTVINSPPTIHEVTIEDDLDDEGVQLLPIPGEERTITVTVEVSDPNGAETLAVTANGEALVTNATGQNGTFSGTVPITTETTSIVVTADDGALDDETTLPIELLPVVGIRIPEEIAAQIASGEHLNTSITVENVGTANTSLHIKGAAPSLAGTILGDIRYTLLGQTFALQETAMSHDIQLAPGEQAEIGLEIQTGFVPAGSYIGRIIVAGAAR